MFENIGQKIKMLAVVSTVIGMIASVISGIIVMAELEQVLLGLGIIAGGCLFAWIGSFVLYGFGELIESAKNTEHNTNMISAQIRKVIASNATAPKTEGKSSSTAVKPAVAPTPSVKATPVATPAVAPTPTVKPTPVVKSTVKKTADGGLSDEKKEEFYLFALQTIERRSYNVAYNILLKIPGYKNADELLKEIENKI